MKKKKVYYGKFTKEELARKIGDIIIPRDRQIQLYFPTQEARDEFNKALKAEWDKVTKI